MRDRLPDTIDITSLSKTGAGTPKAVGREYQGELAVAGMQRLTAALADTNTPALQVRLYIGRDTGGVNYLQGEVQGALHLICQRCLAQMNFPVQKSFRLALVRNEDEAAELGESYDPLLLTQDRLVVSDVIEDELLLVIPDFPQHAEGETCTLADYHKAQANVVMDEKPNPFAALASLKRN